MGRVLSAEGDCANALSQLGTLSSGPLRDWQPLIAGHGYVSAACAQQDLAHQDLKRLEDMEKTRFVTSYGKALIHSGLGDREQTLVWIRKAIEERSHWMVWIRLAAARKPILRGNRISGFGGLQPVCAFMDITSRQRPSMFTNSAVSGWLTSRYPHTSA
jgi:hypothetical protein